MKFILALGTALVFVGAGCANGKVAEAPLKADDARAVAPAAPVTENVIEVKDQKPGDVAMIARVSMDRKGFVVVHEEEGGRAGAIVGKSDLLGSGETRDVSVKMKIHAGLSHMVMIHADNGDGTFDEKQDLPVRDANGEVVSGTFKGEGEAMKKDAAGGAM